LAALSRQHPTHPPSILPLSRHRTPPLLHSFPTRRSSDLPSTCSGSATTGSAANAARAAGRLSAACSTGASGGRTPGAAGGAEAADRKSTRLNSSHVASSYAVFCLKKKKPPSRRRDHLSLS